MYSTWEHSFPVQLGFPRPINHTMFIHLRNSFALSFMGTYTETTLASSSFLVIWYLSVFTHQTLEAPALSLYKPVPWKNRVSRWGSESQVGRKERSSFTMSLLTISVTVFWGLVCNQGQSHLKVGREKEKSREIRGWKNCKWLGRKGWGRRDSGVWTENWERWKLSSM